MDAMQERLKISHRNFEQWKKRMKEAGYDVIGENAFKRTQDETSPSGFRRTRVSNYSKNVRDKPRGQNLPPSAKTSKTPTTQPRTWQSPHGQKSDKHSEGDFRKQFPQNKTKSAGDTDKKASGGAKTSGGSKTNKESIMIGGKKPSAIQKKLLKSGFSVKELEGLQKKHKEWKKNRGK